MFRFWKWPIFHRSPLDSIIMAKLNACVKDVIARQDHPVKEEIEKLEQLEKLKALRDAMVPRKLSIWLFPGLLTMFLLALSFLLFWRLDQTTIVLDVRADALSFTPATDLPFMALPLSMLSVSGVNVLSVPSELAPPIPKDALLQSAGARIEGGPSHAPSREMMLDGLVAAKDNSLFLRAPDENMPGKIIFDRLLSEFRLAVNGPITVSISPQPPASALLERASLLGFSPGDDKATLDFTLTGQKRVTLFKQISINSLQLFYTPDSAGPGSSDAARWSTILSGTVVFADLNGAQRSLRSGELLRFGIKKGELQRLTLEDNSLLVSFVGEVRELAVGQGTRPTILMPTLLEWLEAQHGIFLLWVGTGSVAGVIISFLRWLKVAS